MLILLPGCIWNLTENEKIDAVMYLLIRDFQDLESEITLDQQERISFLLNFAYIYLYCSAYICVFF